MKTWTRLGIGIAALAFAVAIGTAAYAMSGNDDEPASVAAEDARDEATDGDAAQGEGLGLSAICIEGAEDCVDTVDVPYGDFGELPEAKCAADVPDCVEPGCPPDGCTAAMPAMECVLLQTDPPIEECKPIECQAYAGTTEARPPDELVDPVPDEVTTDEELQADIGARAEEAVCAPPLPVCEDPTMSACVPPDCAVSSDGSVSCPGSEPINCLPVEQAPGDDVATQPCMTEPCVGGPAVDCGPIDPIEPCVPGPATDCGVIDCPLGIDPAVDVPVGAPPPCIEPGTSSDPGAAGGGADGSAGSGGTDSGPIE